MSEMWFCSNVNIMEGRFSNCQYENNCKQTKKWNRKQKTEKSTMLNIFNKEEMNTLGVINDHHCEKKETQVDI